MVVLSPLKLKELVISNESSREKSFHTGTKSIKEISLPINRNRDDILQQLVDESADFIQ